MEVDCSPLLLEESGSALPLSPPTWGGSGGLCFWPVPSVSTGALVDLGIGILIVTAEASIRTLVFLVYILPCMPAFVGLVAFTRMPVVTGLIAPLPTAMVFIDVMLLVTCAAVLLAVYVAGSFCILVVVALMVVSAWLHPHVRLGHIHGFHCLVSVWVRFTGSILDR